MKEKDEIYNTFRKKWFDDKLKVHGFKKHKTNKLIKINEHNILHVLNFQKNAHGTPDFCINIVSRPLFTPKERLTLSPGCRLAQKDFTGDKWFHYENEDIANANFELACNMVLDIAFSFFEITKNAASILQAFESKIHPDYVFGSPNWLEYDLAFCYLQENKIEKALEYLEFCKIEFSESDNKDLHTYGKECDTLISYIKNGGNISEILEQNILKTKENLQLR